MSSGNFSEQTLTTLHAKLAAWWDVIHDLQVDSPPQAWEEFASFLNPECTVYLTGMGAASVKGREKTNAGMKDLLGYWAIKERRVLSRTLDLSGRIITANLLNRVLIKGEELDLPEAEVVEFDEQGLILEYKLYVDPSPVMAIFQKAEA